jgi:hypothetical protein
LASNASRILPVYPRRMLTDSTRRDLKQLRFLLEEALARSQQQAEIDRRAAVLLLDGACELSRDVTPQTKYAWSRPHTVFAWSLYLPANCNMFSGSRASFLRRNSESHRTRSTLLT